MNGARGATRERAVKERLERRGYFVIRAAGSKGCADLVALRAGCRPLMVEVKSSARGPFANFPPSDRRRLMDAAAQSGAHAMLAYFPPRAKAITWIPSGAWP